MLLGPTPTESESSEPCDARITADRYETKYLVAFGGTAEIVRILDAELPVHHFRGEDSNPLPDPEHFVTTVYFDTRSRSLFRAAQARAHDIAKLRIKHYYDLHPSLAELATGLDDAIHHTDWTWLELKRRTGTHTTKHRVRILRSDVPRWLSGGEARSGADAGAELLIRRFCSSLGRPLSASALVNYRRASWQSPDARLRVTLDMDLAFFSVPDDLWQRDSLLRETLGTPRVRESHALLEVKQGTTKDPPWLARAVEAVRARPIEYSKFERASEAVLLDV